MWSRFRDASSTKLLRTNSFGLKTVNAFVKFKFNVRKTVVCVATYINNQWSDKSVTVFTFCINTIDYMIAKYQPKFPTYRGTVISDVYMVPFCSMHCFILFYDAFLPLLYHRCLIVYALLLVILSTHLLTPYRHQV